MTEEDVAAVDFLLNLLEDDAQKMILKLATLETDPERVLEQLLADRGRR